MADPHWGPVAARPPAARTTRRAKKKPPKSRGRRWAGRILKGIGVLTALSVIAVAAIVFVGYRTTKLPDADADFTTATSFVYYADGKSELGSLAVQNRTPLPYKDMPDTMTKAIVAAENRSFWTDQGVSIRGMIRSAWVIARGGSLQGGSTITQQYIKILYLRSEQSAARKFKELFLAYKLNKQMTKEQILEGYLNTIYFGHGAYGVQAASHAFFAVDAKDLSVRQAAVLSAVVNNPSYFDPSVKRNRPQLLDRYRYVLNSMSEMGTLSAAQAAAYGTKLPKLPDVPVNERYGGPKGFLLKMVEAELAAKGFDSSQVNGGGLKITTTFDEDAQNAAVDAAQSVTKQAASAAGRKAAKLHAAIASVDVNSGEVLALYGGPDYVKSSRNWATTHRPTGSTFKPYALAAGIKDGYSLYSTFRGNSYYLPENPDLIVRNEYSRNYGYRVSLLKATTDSINTAFVDLVTTMPDGKAKTLKVAKAAGAPKTTGWTAAPRNIPIGTPEVSPLNQAAGYAAFANGGVHVETHVVQEVQDANGKVIYQAKPADKRVVSEDVSRDVTYALTNVVENGTGRSVQTLNRPVAGKTGTNGIDVEEGGQTVNHVNSAWFVGYTKQISTAVMFVAGNAGTSSLDGYARPGDGTFFGGTYPAAAWADYMGTATKGQAVKDFDQPAYVNAGYQSRPYASQSSRSYYPSEPSSPSSASSEPTYGSTDEPSASGSSRPSSSGGPTGPTPTGGG